MLLLASLLLGKGIFKVRLSTAYPVSRCVFSFQPCVEGKMTYQRTLIINPRPFGLVFHFPSFPLFVFSHVYHIEHLMFLSNTCITLNTSTSLTTYRNDCVICPLAEARLIQCHRLIMNRIHVGRICTVVVRVYVRVCVSVFVCVGSARDQVRQPCL